VTDEKQKRRKKVTDMPLEAQELLCKQLINIRLTGATKKDAATALGIPESSVRTLESSDLHRQLLADASDDMTSIIAQTRADLAKLAPDAVRAIKETLREGSHRDKMQAATIVLKSVGLHEDDNTNKDTQIIVNLPHGVGTEAIEVPNETD
jgi:hypothetical protein